jgi:4-hydroxybenzoate polyprenyltransferase
MLGSISHRLLPLLQLTRMALVFTAIADSACGLLLRAARLRGERDASLWEYLDLDQLVATAVISIGLYGFGMSLNDIIDRRRDTQISPNRPLPSGRIGLLTAHVICGLLAASALLGGIYFVVSGVEHGWVTLALIVWTGLLITFYDLAGKYLVWPGLISLGLIRFFHAVIPAPSIPLLWHPLLLFNHVAVLSTIAYRWEEKRPVLSDAQRWAALGVIALVDAAAIGMTAWLRPSSLWIVPGLMVPASAVMLFATVTLVIRGRNANRRAAGQTLMLYGLLWLILYDACFVGAYVGWVEGLLILTLLPLAYLSVQLMRWWSKLVLASQRPEFRRAGASGRVEG